VFQKRDRVSEARSRFGARRVSEERSCFRRSILFQNLDLVSESRSHFRIAILFQNLDLVSESRSHFGVRSHFGARHVWEERFSIRRGTVLQKTVRDFEDGSCIRSSVSTTCHHMKYRVTYLQWRLWEGGECATAPFGLTLNFGV
jgi:hypothetical protein